MEKWERDIRDLRKMADRYPQKSYAAMAHAVQSEWIFMKCVMKDTVQVFKGLEIFMQGNFLPRLFFGKPKILPPIVGYLSTLPVKKSEMELQNPVTLAQEKYISLICASD